jgi:hypothetical protein
VITHADVREIAMSMPDVEERPSYGGRPSWRAKTRMFIWIRDDPEALVIWVADEAEKAGMIASEPKKFFTTPHYDGNPIVLVRLDAVGKKEARELIVESWRLRAPKSLVKQWDAAHP